MGELFQNKDIEEAEAKEVAARERIHRINLKAFLMTIAVVIAPFLALLFSLEMALVVLAAGLAFTIWLTWMGSNEVGPIQKSRLRLMAMMNGFLLLGVLGILAVMLTR